MADEQRIERRLKKAVEQHPERISITTFTDDGVQSMADLLGKAKPRVLVREKHWYKHKKFDRQLVHALQDIRPDLVIRSDASNENKIYIEVKDVQPLKYNKEANQIILYFLHLLATTGKSKTGDMKRAVIVCAPSKWFTIKKNSDYWQYTVTRYSELAKAYHVTLGTVDADSLVWADE